jgi:5'-nucleotidase
MAVRPICVITNDDGIDSVGLHVLAAAARAAGYEVVVVAPADEMSGTSAAMTTAASDRITVAPVQLPGLPEITAYAVQAAPAFIAFTAVRGAFSQVPELLLSGINKGPNTGRSILHSGTVGAAMTATIHGTRAAAFSLACNAGDDGSGLHWATAATVAEQVIPWAARMPPGTLLNVNVPNVPACQLRGVRRGPLAPVGAFELTLDATARDSLQVAVAGPATAPPAGTDAALLADCFASVSPVAPLCEPAESFAPWLAAACRAADSDQP